MSSNLAQEKVAAWFDGTYERDGFEYLRPPEAYPIFLQLLDARPGAELLDVACGPGLLLNAALARGLECTGVDVSSAAIDLAGRFVPEAKTYVRNAEHLEFDDASFDYVTCIAAIERFLDRPAALREIRRVGRDDAKFCFMVRNARTLVWRLWREALGKQNTAGHQDALDLERWTELFAECGFQIDEVFADQWPRQKMRKVMRGFRKREFGLPEPVAKPVLPMRFANEFIFILRKIP